jgi:dihydroorotase
MYKIQLFFVSLAILFASSSHAQTDYKYSLIVKGGHVIDPKNKIDELMDIAVNDGKIVLVSKNINAKQGRQVVDAKGLFVTPGLVDIHVHFFWGTDLQGTYRNGPLALPADGFTFPAGVTTVVDAGSSGWKTFETFKKQTIDRSQTRVLAMLNIVGEGMAGARFENDIEEMDAQKTAEMAKKYPEIVVGVKLAHFNGHRWTPTERAVEAGTLANIPVMVDFGAANPYLSLDSLFNVKLRPGDIYTHAFGGDVNVGVSTLNGREPIVDAKTNNMKPFVLKARKRGIFFDVGFGGASFLFSQGTPATKNGFFPNSISTDLHTGSMNGPMKSMPNIMSVFMALGMPFKDVIAASTWNPAREVKREELGNLSVGSGADIAIFNLREGKFGFYARDGKINGKNRLETEMTIRDGKIVYNLNAIAEPNILPVTDGDQAAKSH